MWGAEDNLDSDNRWWAEVVLVSPYPTPLYGPLIDSEGQSAGFKFRVNHVVIDSEDQSAGLKFRLNTERPIQFCIALCKLVHNTILLHLQ